MHSARAGQCKRRRGASCDGYYLNTHLLEQPAMHARTGWGTRRRRSSCDGYYLNTHFLEQCHACARRVGHKKAENIETLFQLYDRLEATCQDTARLGRTAGGKEAAAAAQLLDELRQRFVRLVRDYTPQPRLPSAMSTFCMAAGSPESQG